MARCCLRANGWGMRILRYGCEAGGLDQAGRMQQTLCTVSSVAEGGASP